MKHLFFTLFLFFSLALNQQTANAEHPRPPVYHHGYHHGVPYGYGHFHFGFWPIVPTYFGYSLWGYYNYLPYYASFGTISYSVKADKAGFAWGQGTLAASMTAANAFCGFDDCRPVVWVQGGCASIATNKDSEALGWGYGVNRYTAEYNAMASCKLSSNAGKCELRMFVCSY